MSSYQTVLLTDDDELIEVPVPILARAIAESNGAGVTIVLEAREAPLRVPVVMAAKALAARCLDHDWSV